MRRLTPAQWATHLRHTATPHADADAPLHVGALEMPFRMAVGASTIERPAQPVERAEIGLWWARVDARVDVDAILAGSAGGTLLAQDRFRAIEAWTDAELSALHALWWLARERGRNDWHERVETVRDWHVLNTQPDNATNRPWALHVFAIADTPECDHYAQTLLHNSMAMSGQPVPLSAWILLDAARALESR